MINFNVVPFSSYLTLNRRDLQMWVIDHWRSSKLLPFQSLGVFYSPSMVTMAVSLTVYEIFNISVYRDLENWVRGCSKSLKMAPFDRSYTTLHWSATVSIALSLGTNLIHDFTAVTFSVKLAFFHEKRPFSCFREIRYFSWILTLLLSFIKVFRVLSTAFVRILLFATCHTSALSSWHVFTVLLTYIQSWVLT